MGKRILLVDDDPIIRTLVGDCLKAYGHQVEQASGGQECLDKLVGSHPEVIILDLIMPDMHGLDVLRNIRSTEHTQAIPVILLSANSDMESWADERKLSANVYLQKPFDIQTILDAVNRLK